MKILSRNGKPKTGDMKLVPKGVNQPRWATCDGSVMNRNKQSSLFSVIGITYGAGNGTTTFNKPNLNGVIDPLIDVLIKL